MLENDLLKGGERNTFASSIEASSSRRGDMACDISDFKEANVLFRSSAPYRCFTRFGRPGCNNFNQYHVMAFSSDGDISSSVCNAVPWCVMLFDFTRLSSKT